MGARLHGAQGCGASALALLCGPVACCRPHAGTAVLQVVLALVCAMFGVLWHRAMARVRRNVMERSAAQRHVADVQSALPLDKAVVAVKGVVRLQALVRRRLATTLRSRLEAMEAYVSHGWSLLCGWIAGGGFPTDGLGGLGQAGGPLVASAHLFSLWWSDVWQV